MPRYEDNLIGSDGPRDTDLECRLQHKPAPGWLPLETYDQVQTGYPYPDHGEMVFRSDVGTDRESRLMPPAGGWIKAEEFRRWLTKYAPEVLRANQYPQKIACTLSEMVWANGGSGAALTLVNHFEMRNYPEPVEGEAAEWLLRVSQAITRLESAAEKKVYEDIYPLPHIAAALYYGNEANFKDCKQYGAIFNAEGFSEGRPLNMNVARSIMLDVALLDVYWRPDHKAQDELVSAYCKGGKHPVFDEEAAGEAYKQSVATSGHGLTRQQIDEYRIKHLSDKEAIKEPGNGE